MQQITDNIWVETGLMGCNHGFVSTREGVVMVDTPWRPSDALRWRDEIAKKGEIRYVINTEPHADHFAGNTFFPGTVVAHQGTREAMAQTSVDQIRERMPEIDPEGLPLMEGYQIKLPRITFSDRLILYLGDYTFELIHLPGHTASETAVYIPQERVVFTGDNVTYKSHVFLHQAYPDSWLQSLDRIKELNAEVIVPGHGGVCYDKGYLDEEAAFIREWMEAVKRAFEQGLSKKQAQDTISFIDRYPPSIGMEARIREFQRLNVARLYDLLAGGHS